MKARNLFGLYCGDSGSYKFDCAAICQPKHNAYLAIAKEDLSIGKRQNSLNQDAAVQDNDTDE